jgi:radical SAM superfamily enzyme YgiQ (UPF0313 family)
MKILLVAVNAKYIHSNPAVYSLRAYAQSFLDAREKKREILTAEYTINQQIGAILRDIYQKAPDMLCFSCYIWNISCIEKIVRDIHKVLPRTAIWLGGPEVSYDAKAVLERLWEVTGVMKGEGEETFAHLAAGEHLRGILGITYRDANGGIVENPWREAVDLNKVPFIYQDMTDFEHRIVYYESSRGCPFCCSYCLSSLEKKLRFRNLELVKRELSFFIEHEVPQVKFVDRTFNCNHKHAMAIWRYIMKKDRGITNFHFEIAADLLNEEELELIGRMRPGLIQLEIGVQTVNPETLHEIRRTMCFEKTAENVRRIQKKGNVHQHLDLIAGLPFENLDSFRRSFNEVYDLRPQQLQLGFLKVLKGSFMEENQKSYGLAYQSRPPYEVLYTKWLSYGDVLKLKGIEEMVEVYYNSGQFTKTMPVLKEGFTDAFTLYMRLAEYYEGSGLNLVNHARAARYEILLGFAKETSREKAELIRELLIYDYYLRENAKSRPEFAGEYRIDKETLRAFYEKECRDHIYLQGYEQYDKNQMRKMTHLEYFQKLGETVLFDYSRRNPLNQQARTVIVANVR